MACPFCPFAVSTVAEGTVRRAECSNSANCCQPEESVIPDHIDRGALDRRRPLFRVVAHPPPLPSSGPEQSRLLSASQHWQLSSSRPQLGQYRRSFGDA